MPHNNDLEQFRDFEFITPPAMVHDDLQLILAETVPYNPQKGWVPYYRFDMVNIDTGVVMGNIDLRVGLTEKLKMLGGHIGYEVDEPYRGHRYAERSCRLLLPFVRTIGINPVVITCDPRNIPSVKTIESLGAKLMETNVVEIDPGMFRPTNVYHLYF
jgi:predicted acetyltransferase